MRLRCIFNNFQIVSLRNFAQRGHVRRLTEEMHRHDRARLAWDNCFFNALRVNQHCARIDIHKNDTKAPIERCIDARDERKIGHDNFAAVIESVVIERCGESDTQRVRAMRQQEPKAASAISGPLVCELRRDWLRQTFNTAQEY